MIENCVGNFLGSRSGKLCAVAIVPISHRKLKAQLADGKYVYHPRVSQNPIPQGKLAATHEKSNPGGITTQKK